MKCVKVVFFSVLIAYSESIFNQMVSRTVDIRTPLIKERIVVLFCDNYNPVTSYEFHLDPDINTHLVEFANAKYDRLSYAESKNETDSIYIIALDRVVEKNETYILRVEIAYFGNIRPYQKSRKFDESQLMLYKGNLYFYSFYFTSSLSVTYVCKPNSNLDVDTEPHGISGNNVTYQFTDVDPYTFVMLKMRFKSDDPFLVVKGLVRTIDVSHFGKISVEDRVDIENEGPKLVGPYHPQLNKLPKTATSWLYTHLPSSASDIQFFDELGNNSNSQILHFDQYSTLKFKPRYPLLSGWRTSYIIRYKLPVHEYLKKNLEYLFLLDMRAVDHVLNDVHIAKATVTILLPEGAYLIEVNATKPWNIKENITEYTSLAFAGRPAVVLSGRDLLENHVSGLKITYLFPTYYLLTVPVQIAAYFELILIGVMLFCRLFCE